MLQLLDPKELKSSKEGIYADFVRPSASLYDEYDGNVDYIHIPDVYQMQQNLQKYPVIVAYNEKTAGIEGILTIKYHENTSQKELDPYYPKIGAKAFSITGVIAKNRGKETHKGIGTCLYASAILGIREHAVKFPKENYHLNAVIDCTNIPSLYALKKAHKFIYDNGFLDKNSLIETIMDGVYAVRDDKYGLVEAPTFVFEMPLANGCSKERKPSERLFSYRKLLQGEKSEQYETLFQTVMTEIKKDNKFEIITAVDKDAGLVEYYQLKGQNIFLSDIIIDRNGAENIADKRVPRRDVETFVGPMPDFRNYIERE